MSNAPKPTLVMGRVELSPTQTVLHPLSRDHRQETLLYQQKVAALIECAREYAKSPRDVKRMEELCKVAQAFQDG